MHVFSDFNEIKSAVGTEIGVSDWIEVSQERINQFAEATCVAGGGDAPSTGKVPGIGARPALAMRVGTGGGGVAGALAVAPV